MTDTLKMRYDGWDITVRCLRFHSPQNHGQGGKHSYTASGRAVRHSAEDDGDWTDARPQVATLSGRIFDSTATCAEVLMAEMTVLIDALRKERVRERVERRSSARCHLPSSDKL